MKFDVLEEKENPVLKRKEIIISLNYGKGTTPSKADLQKAVSEQLNANIENIEITKILSEIGKPMGKAWIKIWQEKKVPLYDKKKTEVKEEPAAEVKKEEPKQEQTKQAATDEHVEEVAPKEGSSIEEHVEEASPKQEGE